MGHTDILMTLLDRCVDIENKDEQNRTPLHHAASRGHKSAVIALLCCGANIRAKTKVGRTAFHLAVSFENQPDVVTVLIESGAKIEPQDEQGWTPLHHA